MKQNLLKYLLLGLAIFLFVTGCVNGIAAPLTQVILRIGFCPTMQEEMIEISEKYPAVELIKYESSAEAIQSLQAKEIDAVLVGRKPFTQEISEGLEFHQLKPGATLVSQQQGLILYDDLPKIIIHTSLEPKVVNQMLPRGTKVTYLHANELSIFQEANLVILKEWDQVGSDEKLLIPVNEHGEKTPSFRTPFLVILSSNIERLENFLAVILPVDQE